jgi:hypothetical protein
VRHEHLRQPRQADDVPAATGSARLTHATPLPRLQSGHDRAGHLEV